MKLRKFNDSLALGEALANRVCMSLEAGIKKRGKAVLAVSGGSTPRIFFKILSSRPIEWQRVFVTLVDERWVGEDDIRSNGALVRENLLISNASRAKFIPLFSGNEEPGKAVTRLEADILELPMPFDATILGMGLDGHTASFFPGGDNLSIAVDPLGKRPVCSMRAPSVQEPRVTLTLPILVRTKFLALHIEGKNKLAVLEEALKNDDADIIPIRHVLRATGKLEVYWTP